LKILNAALGVSMYYTQLLIQVGWPNVSIWIIFHMIWRSVVNLDEVSK